MRIPYPGRDDAFPGADAPSPSPATSSRRVKGRSQAPLPGTSVQIFFAGSLAVAASPVTIRGISQESDMGASAGQGIPVTAGESPRRRSLPSTPSVIIDPVGAFQHVPSKQGPYLRDPPARRPVLWGVLIAGVGFAIMHALFVGGEHGPLLPTATHVDTSTEMVAATKPPQRTYTHPREPTDRESVLRDRRMGHPLPPPRPKRTLT
jgi:hypothetical protein